MNNHKIMLSAIQPTNVPHLGNYLGALRNWVHLYEQYTCYFFVVDLHSITVAQDPKVLRESIYQVLAYYIASGLDPEKVTLFCQSHVPQHSQLSWMLTCFTYMGELNRMTQFKDKSQKQGQNIGAGLFTYPCLMAADILLYGTHFVPVGEDQKQHVELARNLAIRVNNRFESDLFVVPEPVISQNAARIMDLQSPTQKMSKSAQNPKGTIFMDESDKQIAKKIKSAQTDSGDVIEYTPEKPGIRNLLEIHKALSGQSIDSLVESYSGKLYGHLKVDVADLCVATLGPIRDEALRLLQDKAYLHQVMERGAEAARAVAQRKLDQVLEVMGFVV